MENKDKIKMRRNEKKKKEKNVVSEDRLLVGRWRLSQWQLILAWASCQGWVGGGSGWGYDGAGKGGWRERWCVLSTLSARRLAAAAAVWKLAPDDK